MFFTDNDIDNFIKTKVSKYSNTFYNLKYKIQRLDFFRYLAVYYYGGIYLDLDIDIQKRININFSKCVLPIEYETCTDKLLLNQNNKFAHCLDFGCGSGILGMSALKLSPMKVDFCDIEIVPTTGDNDDQDYAN